MPVIRQTPIPFDVDETLILWRKPRYARLVKFKDPFEKHILDVAVHEPHFKMLKNHIAQGHAVFVWSHSGYKWALAALRALGIRVKDHKNLYVMKKPVEYVDDIPARRWMSHRTYLKPNSPWGRAGEEK